MRAVLIETSKPCVRCGDPIYWHHHGNPSVFEPAYNLCTPCDPARVAHLYAMYPEGGSPSPVPAPKAI